MTSSQSMATSRRTLVHPLVADVGRNKEVHRVRALEEVLDSRRRFAPERDPAVSVVGGLVLRKDLVPDPEGRNAIPRQLLHRLRKGKADLTELS